MPRPLKRPEAPIDPYKAQPLPLGRPAAVYYRQSSEGQIGNVMTTLQTIDMIEHLLRQGWVRENVHMIDMDAAVSGTVAYDAHTRTGCFSPAEIDAAAGSELVCTVDSSLTRPDQSLALSLRLDPEVTAEQDADGAYLFTVGDTIPLIAEVSAAGGANITEDVQIELTVPRGLAPQGMTIRDEDSASLQDLFGTLIDLLGDPNPNFSELLNDILQILVGETQITYTYTIEQPLIAGQPFPITLDVVGDLPGKIGTQSNICLPWKPLNSSMVCHFLSARHSRHS
jgi:hypothetical protein